MFLVGRTWTLGLPMASGDSPQMPLTNHVTVSQVWGPREMHLPLTEPLPSHQLLGALPWVCTLSPGDGRRYLHPFFLMMFPKTTSALWERPDMETSFWCSGNIRPRPTMTAGPLVPSGARQPGCWCPRSLGQLTQRRAPAKVAVAQAPAHPVRASSTLCPAPWRVTWKTLGSAPWAVSG